MNDCAATGTLRIGGLAIPLEQAAKWTAVYFDENTNLASVDPFAYPYYDQYDGRSGPNELSDGDLLAPAILNASPKLVGYSTLFRLRGQLERGLAAIPEDLSLQAAVEAGTHRALLAGLVSAIDPHGAPGVKLTILAKVLHRKRPLFFPLYDSKVDACYVRRHASFPMRRQRRNYSVFMGEIASHMCGDLVSQPGQWKQLAAIAPAGVSPLRLLDVVAWNAGSAVGKHS